MPRRQNLAQLADEVESLASVRNGLRGVAKETFPTNFRQPNAEVPQAAASCQTIMALLHKQVEQGFSSYERAILQGRISRRAEPSGGVLVNCDDELNRAEREILILTKDLLDTITQDIALATKAMLSGGCEETKRPASPGEAIGSFGCPTPSFAARQAKSAALTQYTTRLAALTQRQKSVLQMVMAGEPSKNIAVDLGIAQRTVEGHRAQIMRRLGVRTIPELIQVVMSATPTASRA